MSSNHQPNWTSKRLSSSTSSSKLKKRSGPEKPSTPEESSSSSILKSSSLFGPPQSQETSIPVVERQPPKVARKETSKQTAPAYDPNILAVLGIENLKYDPVIEKIKNFHFIKIKNPESLKEGVTTVKEKITFDWKNTNLAFVNTFRRVLISEIETYVLGNFKFHNFLPTNSLQGCRPLDMSRLQPVMHNEQLSLALELIPISQDIYQEDYIRKYLISQELPKETFSFENIRVCLGINKTTDEKLADINPEGYKNKDKPIEDIHTDKLKIFVISNINQRVVGEIPNEQFFPNKVLITKLKKDQTIGFCCSLILGVGSSNAKFTPVCSASFHYDEPEPEILQSDYKMTYETPDPPFNHRLVTTFHFLVHSLPYWTPEYVLFRGLSSFKRVIDRFLLQLTEIIKSKKFELEIIDGNTSLVFILENENYTIGNIIQNYLAEPTMMESYPSGLPKVVFAGFIIEHPKIKKMKCRVTVEGIKEDSVFAVIDHVVKQIKIQIDKTEMAFEKAFPRHTA